jgi:hypothetical protein
MQGPSGEWGSLDETPPQVFLSPTQRTEPTGKARGSEGVGVGWLSPLGRWVQADQGPL